MRRGFPAPPTRVVSAGLTDADDLLALGVVPSRSPTGSAAEPFGVWPWAFPRLGGAQPVVLNLADGVQVDQIATLKPDLIVATDAGLDRDTYTRLSAVAPTIAQSGRDAFFEPWKDQATAIGQAVFRHDDTQRLIADVDAKFGAVKDANPRFDGTKVLLLGGTLQRDGVQVLGPGWRREFLAAMGLTVVDTDESLIPRDRLAAVARLRRCPDLDHRERRGTGRAAGRPDDRGARPAPRVHRQGDRRRDRLRLDAVLPGGRREAAADDRRGAVLI